MAKFDFNYAIILKDKFSSPTKNVRRALDNMDHAIQRSSKHLETMGTKFSNLGRRLIIPTAALVLAVRKGIDEADTYETSIGILNLTLGKHDKYIQRVINSTEKYQKVTRYSQEQQLAAAQIIVQFTKSAKMAQQLLIPMMNMASSVPRLTKNLPQVALLVAKSLMSTDNALSLYGITLTKGIKGYAKYQEILAGLDRYFKGAAIKAGKAGIGQLIIMGHLVGEVWRDVGIIVIPTLDKIANRLKPYILRLDDLVNKHKKIVIIVGLAIGAFILLSGTAMILAGIIGMLTITFGVLSGAVAAIGLTLDFALGPIGLIAAAIYLITTLVITLNARFHFIRPTIKLIGEQFVRLWHRVLPLVHLFERLNTALFQVEKSIAKLNFTKRIFDDISRFFGHDKSHTASNLQKFYAKLRPDPNKILPDIPHDHIPTLLARNAAPAVHVTIDVNDPTGIIKKTHMTSSNTLTRSPMAYNMSHINA